jgi:protein-disulfide isomerase
MKRFYLLLAAVVVAGGVWLWWASREKGAAAPAAGASPVPAAASDGFTGYTLGSDSAPIEIVEYADYQCGHCGEFAVLQFPVIKQQLIATGRVRWRLRDFPLGFPWSRLSALAAQCAGEQGKFWPMADTLFLTQSEWGRQARDPSGAFRSLAVGVGVDRDKYDACMAGTRYAGRIEASHEEGVTRGVNGTPTFFVNGSPWPDTHNISSDRFRQVVDSVIAAKKKR